MFHSFVYCQLGSRSSGRETNAQVAAEPIDQPFSLGLFQQDLQSYCNFIDWSTMRGIGRSHSEFRFILFEIAHSSRGKSSETICRIQATLFYQLFH